MLITNMLTNHKPVNKTQLWKSLSCPTTTKSHDQSLRSSLEPIYIFKLEVILGVTLFSLHPEFVNLLMIKPRFGFCAEIVQWEHPRNFDTQPVAIKEKDTPSKEKSPSNKTKSGTTCWDPNKHCGS